MNNCNVRLALALAASLIPSLVSAQHEAHQPASTQGSSAELTQCLRVQPVIGNIITAATGRAEAARLSNSPTDMRAALESLEAALRDIRAQSAPCATAAASTDPHAGHTMPSAAPASKDVPTPKPAPSKPSKPAAADPHTGHTMPGATPPSKGATRAKPTPSKTSKPARTDSHAGHTPSAAPTARPAPAAAKPEAAKPAHSHTAPSSAKPGDKPRDPVNGLIVDPTTAPKTTYQGQTYYFSSEQSRKEFLENPAKFAKKPKG